MTDIPIIVAFIAGLVSFLSPCVLPLIPGFLSYLAGSTKDSPAPRRAIMLASLFFVLGFSFVFSLLGILLNTVLSGVAYEAQTWLSRIGGIIIITFGLYLAGLLKIPFLEKEYRLQVKWKFNSRLLTAFVFGAAFAAGWTPCVGAVLGSILALAATAPGSAFYLLFSYTLGLGIPFLIVGAFAGAAGAWIARSGNILRYVNIIFGIILVLLGILIFTENLPKIANFDFINALIQR
ncbi:MAG: cytochrome c biogenesis protein CcdA [Patescibacteria group bacterium]